MNRDALNDLLQFYRKDLSESLDGHSALAELEITSPEIVEHFQIGWCSGKAYEAASEEQRRIYKQLGLLHRRSGEKLINCLVIPVYNEHAELVDMVGIKQYQTKSNSRRYIYWQKQSQGLIGISCLNVYPEIILADNPYLGLHIRQYGFQNVIALRTPDEIKQHVQLLKRSNVKRVYLCSRQAVKTIEPHLTGIGIEVVTIPYSTKVKLPSKESFEIIGKHDNRKNPEVKLIAQGNHRLHFTAGELTFHIESSAMSGLGMKCQIKAERGKTKVIDKIDLASASSRQKYSRMVGSKIGLASYELEAYLDSIANELDNMILKQAQETVRLPKVLTLNEESAAKKLLQRDDLLQLMADALESCCGIVGEEINRKLCVLITASRLLDKPLGCIIRGNPGSGKSSLISAASKLLPPTDVLYLSRLTPQALYFLPKEQLQHKLLVIDEYEGIANSEYSLRSMMSSQMLSLAITVREGGKLPTTQLHEIPAKLAVMVSSTQSVNAENLSRMIELKMDSSSEQTKRVLKNIAAAFTSKPPQFDIIRNANQLLKPCNVIVPFADKLVFNSSSVQARRQFGQLIGLIKAHAGLMQAHREHQGVSDGTVTIVADEMDYKAVHGLLGAIVTHNEESLTPFTQNLLDTLTTSDKGCVTIKEVMGEMRCSYSKAYRSLGDLQKLGLVQADKCVNGIERSYMIAPYTALGTGMSGLPEPEKLYR